MSDYVVTYEGGDDTTMAEIAQSSPFLRNNPGGRIRVQPVFEPAA